MCVHESANRNNVDSVYADSIGVMESIDESIWINTFIY